MVSSDGRDRRWRETVRAPLRSPIGSAARWRRSLSALAVAALCLLGACTSLPADYPPPPHTEALAPDPTTHLGHYVAEFACSHGAGVSGYAAIDINGDGLRWRLALVDTAERSLDMLYYLWYDDPGGLLLLGHVIDAAERGVRVRIVVDDTLFVGGKQGLANLASNPNIEIRVFNPWARAGVARVLETVAHAKRLNYRMHNKLLIADGQMAILGGRNVGNHYFGLHHKYNFHDLDMAVLGDAASASSEIFDHFWNSERVMPATAFVKEASWEAIQVVLEREEARLREDQDLAAFPLERRAWDDELTALADRMAPGTSTPEYDRLLPETMVPSQDAVARLAEIVAGAEREVLIVNAYIIPGQRMIELLRSLGERGVRVRMLTNSLASHDVPAVASKYKKYRRALLEAGVELYEFRSDPEIQPGIVDTPPVTARFAGLHTKTAVIDRETVYIGSLNLDPRSIRINTEMGMLVTSQGLARQVADIVERDMGPANAWQVHIDQRGKLTWESTAGVVTKQPARSGWQRVQEWMFGVVPEGQL